MKEIVIISGKGGTGKTSLTAAFAALAQNAVLADCDVDAADLHLVMNPKIALQSDFSGGRLAEIDPHKCVGCGKCAAMCRFDAISLNGPGNDIVGKTYRVDPIACEGCKVCVEFCPVGAIAFEPATNGQWFVSETRFGPMVHARLGIAQENSGKLVTLIRREAKRIAEEQNKNLLLVDGSPGIGCPVIASIAGADAVLVVTEPTLSGRHDLDRVARLASNFGIKTMVCVNKADINAEMTGQISAEAAERGLKMVGQIPYDDAFTKAQIMKATLVEYTGGAIVEKIKAIWRQVILELEPKTTKDMKGNTTMRFAIPLHNGKLCQHFGHCDLFAVIDTDNGAIAGRKDVTPPPHEPGVLPKWLHEQGVNIILAGGMGQRAQQLFTQNSIEVIVGAPVDTPENLVTAYHNQTLQAGANTCDH